MQGSGTTGHWPRRQWRNGKIALDMPLCPYILAGQRKEIDMNYHVKMIAALTEFLGQGNREAIEARIVWHKIQLRKEGIFAI